MYKNLSPSALGVSGRQSELIELALTYGFRGLELDIDDMVKRVRNRDLAHARRFLDSAQMKIGGFRLPVNWRGDDASFKTALTELEFVAEIAASLGAKRCRTDVLPTSDQLAFQENFELHRQRLTEMGDLLAKHGLTLGLCLVAAADRRQQDANQFIFQVEPILTLINAITAKNVGLTLDSWNWWAGGGGFDQLREVPVERIVSVWLADASADAAPNSAKSEQCLLPGSAGVIDNVRLLKYLSEADYEGPVTVYGHPKHFLGMTRDSIVQKAQETIDQQLREAGLSRSGKPLAAAEGAAPT